MPGYGRHPENCISRQLSSQDYPCKYFAFDITDISIVNFCYNSVPSVWQIKASEYPEKKNNLKNESLPDYSDAS